MYVLLCNNKIQTSLLQIQDTYLDCIWKSYYSEVINSCRSVVCKVRIALKDRDSPKNLCNVKQKPVLRGCKWQYSCYSIVMCRSRAQKKAKDGVGRSEMFEKRYRFGNVFYRAEGNH